MTPSRWQQIEEIFQAALDLKQGEREIFVENSTGGDLELKAEVKKLLDDFDSADSFIESPVWTDSRFLNSAAKNEIEHSLDEEIKSKKKSDSMIGRRIGVYELKEEIGRGGMGAVYLAERIDGEFRQKVAIKLIKRGMDTDFVLSRFRSERQILANLNHPNVVLLLDGGTTDDGLPYFVMDFVEGEPLHKYCNRKNLSLRERLELFRQVCEAVDYAHRQKVVHRDLKPSNILVNNYGIPKLLDFGIAKLLDPDLANNTLIPTGTQMRLMTPEYASPEQVCGAEITPVSDIYSLGILLYELVTGLRPYKFPTRAPHEIARIICEEDPAMPSEAIKSEFRLKKYGLQNTDVNNNRNNSAEFINTEIDKIILMALRKAPAERYQSAAGLSEDILNFLENRPVKARFFEKSKRNKTLKEAGEHSIAVLPFKLYSAPENANADNDNEYLAVALPDALVMRLSGVERLVVRPTGSVLRYAEETADPFVAGQQLGVDFVVQGSIRITGERIRVNVQLLNVADESSRWAERFNEKFSDVLELEDSISEKIAVSLLPYLTGEERRRLEKRGTNNVEAYEAYLRGRYFWNKMTPDGMLKSLEMFEKAIKLDPDYAQAYVGVADFYLWIAVLGKVPAKECSVKARAAAHKALELDGNLSEAYTSLGALAYVDEWDWAKGDRLIKKALELNPNNWLAYENLAYGFITTGQFDEGVKAITTAEKLNRLSPRTIDMSVWVLYQARRFEQAASKAREALELEPDFPLALMHLGNVLIELGEYEEAIQVIEKSITLAPPVPVAEYFLAHAYAGNGQPEKAKDILSNLKQLAAERYVNPYFIALACVACGEIDQAFEFLEKSLAEESNWLIWLGVEPKLDPLRGDSRFANLLRRTKNPAAEKFISDFKTNQTRDEKAIAVLPFKLLNPNNTGGENEDEFLSIGLADSLITRLSNVKRFIVRPTSSVLPFGKPEVNPFAAGRELGVNYVLDGNIRRAGQRIRVTVQLLNTNDDSTEWAQKFDEDSADVMELEDSISARVADSLLPHLTGDERLKLVKRGTNNAEAYEAYLRGRFFWNRFTADSLPKALEWFQKAIELDPNYALAYVGLADFYTWANIYGILPASQSHPSAERAARKALELDATLGEAYAALALVHSNQWSWAECVRLYEKAIELNPNYPNVHEWYSAYLVSIGETDKGVKEILRAEELDPISLRTMTLVAWTIYQARMFDRTIEKARQIIELDKNYPQGYLQLGNALTEINRHDEAVEAIRKSIEMMPESPLPVYCLCFALARAGRVDEARLVVTELEQTAAIRFVKPYFLAMANAAIGELDNAFKYFEMAADARDPWLLWLGTDAKLDFLRRDPRFIKLFRLMGNPLAFKQPPRPESLFQTTGGGEKSIAVLPLKMLGDFNQKIDTGEEFLGIGLADSLIMRLNQLRSFIVRPTSSVMRFNGSEIEAFEAGRILDVRYVLDGNIRRADRRFRITLQLLDVKNQSTVWAEQFNGDTDDIFRLEDEISEQVAKSLLPQLSSNQQKQLAKRGTDNAKAFDFYMRGRFYWNQFSLEGFSKAFAFYQRAVEIEPNYALAYTGLADYFNFLGVYTVKPFAETAAKAKELSLKALSLDPSLAEAEAALGFSVTMHDFDWAKAEKHFSNAIELNPNYVLGRVWFCYFLGMQKRFDEALVHIEYAMKLDSTTPIVPQTLCWTQFYARRYQEAIAATQQLITREPEYGLSYIFLSQALSTVGRYEEAVSEAEKGVRLLGKSPYTLCWFASVCAAAKLETETHNLLKEIHQFEESRYVSPYMIGMVYSNLRDKERALLQLEKALSIRDGRLMWLGVDPQFDWLRDDSGFQALLRRTGNPTAQKK